MRVLPTRAPSRAIRQPGIDPDRTIPSYPGELRRHVPDELSMSLPQEGVKFTLTGAHSPSKV